MLSKDREDALEEAEVRSYPDVCTEQPCQSGASSILRWETSEGDEVPGIEVIMRFAT